MDANKCYIANDGAAYWDYNVSGITYRSVAVSLMRWAGDSWVVGIDPVSGHAIGLFGDVLAADYDAAMAQIVLPIVYTAPTGPPSGATGSYSCAGSTCAWECDI